MKDLPCNVCGSTDLNLVDGFYYCVECGTQDVNIRETIVEESFFADGTKLLTTGKKFSIMVKEGIQMSAEWYKWHAYNFILYGLTEELIKVGAKQSVKTKVFWIWTRYMKKFHEKEENEKENLESQSKIEGNPRKRRQRSKSSESLDGTTDPESDEEEYKPLKYIKNIAIITKGLLLAILYLALNFDKSPIQLSHLFRFIKEDRLSLFNCTKFVPKEIETDLIPCWKNFCQCKIDYKLNTILNYAMTCVKVLDLGCPIVPDFNKMIHNYIKELCLPNDFKNLVFSLMVYQPYDFVKLNKGTLKRMVRIPDYETVAMSYILVALKMCFGLDGSYEKKINNVIDKINGEENHIKSYKIGLYTESTDRLFSFDEWIRFLQFRKILICQYYLPMARHYNLEVDDYVLMEHLEERRKRRIKLSDEVTMDILNKIPYQNNMNVIPKCEFQPSLTPMSSYTDVILNIVPNDEMRLFLGEDFTQYNIKYAIENKLTDVNERQIITGINEMNLKIEPDLDRNIDVKRSDTSMVFVRNCENKNWLKTKPPALEHIKQNEDGIISDDFDSMNETEIKTEEYEDTKFEYFEEEQEGINIFDDDFDFLVKDDKSILEEQPNFDIEEQNFSMGQLTLESESNGDILEENFDKDAIINELISIALKKYKFKLPKEYVPRPRKRKANTETCERLPKQRKQRIGDVKGTINNMIGSYYNHIENDILTKVTERVRDAFEGQDNQDGISDNLTNGTADVSHAQSNDLADDVINNSINTEEKTMEVLNVTNIDENEDLDPNLNKENLDFDAKTHDIGQLYVEVNNDEINESIAIEDPKIDEIIISKIEKFTTKEVINVFDMPFTHLRKNKLSLCVSDESEDEMKRDNDKDKEYFPPLINDQSQINEFNYWLRIYKNDCIARYSHAYFKFDTELKDQFPASFYFVINECANIICCPTYNLYKQMQNLEKMIIEKLDKLRR